MNTAPTTRAERAVARGIDFLDAHAEVIGGDWRKRIDPDTLDIHSCRLCILGQLFADDFEADEGCCAISPFELGLDKLDGARELGSPISPEALGFDASATHEYGVLTEAWKRALENA